MNAAQQLSLRAAIALAAAIVALQALILFALGRVPICTCGYVKFWEGDVLSPGNSQHISDWYTLSHFVHGFGFYCLFWFVRPRWSIGARLAAAVFLEASWEVVENTDLVIGAYRAETISLSYYGDSILNSVCDTITAILGFVLARWLPIWLTIACVLGMELVAGYFIHDNLTLNVIMLIHPIPWIKTWQNGGLH